MIDRKKTTQDLLQEELLRERAAVLARTGERLAQALEKLHGLERELEAAPEAEFDLRACAYNRQREEVLTRYHYLIVTREALGLIHHQRLAEFYRIPPKRRRLTQGTAPGAERPAGA
jgi:hypothetical protein